MLSFLITASCEYAGYTPLTPSTALIALISSSLKPIDDKSLKSLIL